jgi:hypothetical protein
LDRKKDAERERKSRGGKGGIYGRGESSEVVSEARSLIRRPLNLREPSSSNA